MKELIEALTRAANAFAAHYEGAAPTTRATPTETEAAQPEEAPAPRRTRVKKETPVETAGAADVGLDAPAPAKAKKGEMTEEESAKAVTDTAKLLVSKFSKPVAPDNKPEGFHIAKKILIEGFKVGRLSDLSHDQRIDFVKQVKEILTKEPVGV